jgi:ABC-type phosphate/phosphonate transport system substrate-binding protein
VTHRRAQNVNFGIISTESTRNLKPIGGPDRAMQEMTGLKVTASFAPDLRRHH